VLMSSIECYAIPVIINDFPRPPESNITGKRDVEPKIMSSAFAISYGKRERGRGGRN
jgi:hypothetical protein